MTNNKLIDKKSKAKKIKVLLKTYKSRWGSYQEMANFQGPVMFLIRRTGKTEFFDNVTTGWFSFEHTDTENRRIKLSPEFLLTFDYGKKNFQGYICHEDHPTPLPEKPVITGEQFEWAINKTQHDITNHKAKEYSAKGEMWLKVLTGLAILFGVAIVGKLLVPDLFSFGKTVVESVPVQTTIEAVNITQLP